MSLSPTSGPGATDALTRAVLDFRETAGAGTYAAAIALPAGAHILDCILIGVAPWAATTADLNVTDTSGTHTYYGTDYPLIDNLATPYNPAAVAIDANYAAMESESGTYHLASYVQGTKAGPGVIYFAADTLTATVVTTGAGGATGHMQVIVIGFGVPAGTVNAAKS